MRGKDDKSRLSYWFPLIESAGLPVPRTKIIRLADGENLYDLLDGNMPACMTSLVDRIEDAAKDFGTPFFLRTDYTSAKHDWADTCCVKDVHLLSRHIAQIVEYSECVDMIALPSDVWVVREMLKTNPAFHAFRQMPIVREFRFFVRDGSVEHTQPYWPADSITQPDCDHWRDWLAAMSVLDNADRSVLSDMTLRANQAVPGYWSVDWLDTVDRGWVLTDMAEGDASFKYEPSSIQEEGK